jgi:hypothetical protein
MATHHNTLTAKWYMGYRVRPSRLSAFDLTSQPHVTYRRHEYEVISGRVCDEATEFLDVLVVELIANPHHLFESLFSRSAPQPWAKRGPVTDPQGFIALEGIPNPPHNDIALAVIPSSKLPGPNVELFVLSPAEAVPNLGSSRNANRCLVIESDILQTGKLTVQKRQAGRRDAVCSEHIHDSLQVSSPLRRSLLQHSLVALFKYRQCC